MIGRVSRNQMAFILFVLNSPKTKKLCNINRLMSHEYNLMFICTNSSIHRIANRRHPHHEQAAAKSAGHVFLAHKAKSINVKFTGNNFSCSFFPDLFCSRLTGLVV